ncbi:MAG: aminotransferase class IV [Chloroflexota bacterium]
MSGPDTSAKERVYLDGRLVSASEARVSAFDYGFLYGYGLFETMRAYCGVVFRLEEHVSRLLRAAGRLGFPSLPAAEHLAEACRLTLEANSLREARVRLMVTPGEGPVLPDLSSCVGPTVMVVCRQHVPYPPEAYEQGFSALVSQQRRNSQSVSPGVKSLSWLENVLARSEAARAGSQEALFLNERGMLAEGSSSNVFIVSGEALVTPALDSGILLGITRRDVVVLARSLGMAVKEREVNLEELFQADEAFLTNSIMEIMPLTKVDGRRIGSGVGGTWTRRLMDVYHRLVEQAVRRR